MKTLRQYIQEASQKGVAVGHFNISNIEGLWGIFNAAKKLNLPIIIGTSEGEREFVGVSQAVALVKSFREANKDASGEPYPIFLNADHTYSFDKVKEAIDAGYDSVIFDGAQLPIEENIAITKQCVEYSRKVSAETGRDIIIEAELGYIGTSSKVWDSLPKGIELDPAFLTSPEDAKRIVSETGIDMFAPAVGNVHGIIKSGEPALNIEHIKAIKEAVGVPLVLHGASGNSDEDIKKSIAAGISVVHINTEIRVAYTDALRKFLAENPDEVAPYKIMKNSVKAVEVVVEKKLRLFNNL
ncbi:MAG: class II fructose-bisphosphate aldolase [bacterium]